LTLGLILKKIGHNHKSMKQLAKKTLLKIFAFFPQRLPVGAESFNKFCDSIFAIYDIPDLPSYRNAIATMIMHLSPTTDRKATYYFAKSIRKAMANQVAYEIIQKLREDQKAEEQKQEATLKNEEATLVDDQTQKIQPTA
jgi:GR25 family glycosyltransferase involved in LPS biosynthesis